MGKLDDAQLMHPSVVQEHRDNVIVLYFKAYD